MIRKLRRCKCGCRDFKHVYLTKISWEYRCIRCGRQGQAVT